MAPSVHPDAVAAARAGAGWAFARLYETLGPAVLGYLTAQGATDPEAALQEVFLRAFGRLGEFSGPDAGLRPWIFSVAHNLVIDERRVLGRRPPAVPLASAPETVSGDAEADALARLSGERVARLLATLAPDQRDVLLLRVLADLSHQEIAAAMGRSVGAVKALQRRGLDHLRARLEEILPEAVPR